MTSRGSSYSAGEDVLLCEVYAKISPNSVTAATGLYESKDQFWSRVEDAYNRSKSREWNARNKRSLQCRVQTIEKAVRKLCACIKQVRSTNPDGGGAPSDQDVLSRAKMLLMEDVNYKRGFKFDHVWNIVNDFEKFKDNVLTVKQCVSSESDNLAPESNVPISPGFSSSSNHDDACDSSSYERRPIWVKKAQLKRKAEEKLADYFDRFKDQTLEIMKLMMKAKSDKQQYLERSLALKQLIRDDKILMLDLNNVSNLNIRAYFQAQQAQILQKRGYQHQQS